MLICIIMSMVDKDFTSIRISKGLLAVLKDLGKKGESYENVIWRLVNKSNKK